MSSRKPKLVEVTSSGFTFVGDFSKYNLAVTTVGNSFKVVVTAKGAAQKGKPAGSQQRSGTPVKAAVAPPPPPVPPPKPEETKAMSLSTSVLVNATLVSDGVPAKGELGDGPVGQGTIVVGVTAGETSPLSKYDKDKAYTLSKSLGSDPMYVIGLIRSLFVARMLRDDQTNAVGVLLTSWSRPVNFAKTVQPFVYSLEPAAKAQMILDLPLGHVTYSKRSKYAPPPTATFVKAVSSAQLPDDGLFSEEEFQTMLTTAEAYHPSVDSGPRPTFHVYVRASK